MRGGRKADFVYHHAGSDGNLTVETNEDGTSDEAEILKRYAKIGEAVCGIASQGDDAEVRRKGDGSFAIYAVKKNKVTV